MLPLPQIYLEKNGMWKKLFDKFNVEQHEKNSFAEVSKNLTKYRSENNFVWLVEIIM